MAKKIKNDNSKEILEELQVLEADRANREAACNAILAENGFDEARGALILECTQRNAENSVQRDVLIKLFDIKHDIIYSNADIKLLSEYLEEHPELKQLDCTILLQVMQKLDKTLLKTVQMNYGLGEYNNHCHTLQEISDEFDIDIGRVGINLLEAQNILRIEHWREMVKAKYKDVEDILDKPIEFLDLSIRLYKCLKAAKFKTIGELSCLSEERIRRIKNIGKTNSDELISALEEVGITIQTDSLSV